MPENNPFLSEGYDFIEESTPFSIEPLEFKEVTEIDISESKKSSNNFKLIGKVRGCMAPIGVYSRNHRVYEDQHWPMVLSNPMLQERLANRSLYGMPSHMQKPIDDEDFREGRISHIVSVLEVRNDDKGNPFLYGEFDILDTPAGRILKAMYEGGAGIYVSTRAAGRLLPIPGDPINKRVDSSNYYLGGIDCVLNPGFLQAKPAFEAAPVVEPQVNLHESAQGDTENQGSSEISMLKSQIDKLTSIIEKVVDDVYEPANEEVQKQPIVQPKEDKEPIKVEEKKREIKLTEENRAALISVLSLLSELDISEKVMEETLDTLVDKLKG